MTSVSDSDFFMVKVKHLFEEIKFKLVFETGLDPVQGYSRKQLQDPDIN